MTQSETSNLKKEITMMVDLVGFIDVLAPVICFFN